MSCSPFDLRDYFLRELTGPQQHQVEAHVKTCQGCREELDRLRFTEAALCALREEEIPQRIAFVSDKIFEPSPWRRWLAGFWGSAARLGFASAAMLSAAIVVYALRPAPAPVLPKAPQQIVQAVSAADIEARIDAAVARAAAQWETRQAENNRQLVKDLETARKRLEWAAAELDLSERRGLRDHMLASNYGGPNQNGGGK